MATTSDSFLSDYEGYVYGIRVDGDVYRLKSEDAELAQEAAEAATEAAEAATEAAEAATEAAEAATDAAEAANSVYSYCINIFPGFCVPDDSAYWYDLADNWTILENGWARCEVDNSSGSSIAYADAYQIPLDTLTEDTSYICHVELRNIDTSGTVRIYPATYDTSTDIGQAGANSYVVVSESNADVYTTITTASDFTDAVASLRTSAYFTAGASGSFECRISLYEDTDYTGPFTPYEEFPVITRLDIQTFVDELIETSLEAIASTAF